MTFEEHQRLAVETSARSMADLFDGVPAATRQELGLSHRPLAGGTLLAAARLDHLMLNRLVGALPTGIDTAVATYEQLGVSRYLLSFDAEVFDDALRRGAAHRLERFRRRWATLIRSPESTEPLPDPEPPEGIQIRPALPHDAEALGALMAEAFDVPARGAPIFSAAVERPGWLALVAEQAGTLAGAGTLFVERGCAFLAGGATAPEFRRRGIQRALIAARMRWALERGVRLICSETGMPIADEPNPSWRNLRRAGLKPVHVQEHLCPGGARWAEP